MGKNKLFFLGFLLYSMFSLTCCKSIDLSGHYIEYENYETKHDLELKKNYSFIYIIREGIGIDTIKGVWNRRRKIITLVPNKTYCSLNETSCDTCTNPYFEIYDTDHNKLLNPEISLSKVDNNVEIKYVGYVPCTFRLPNKYNIYKIILIEERTALLARDQTLKIRMRKLITESGMILFNDN